MIKLIFFSAICFSTLASCTNKNLITGKWERIEKDGVILHFISDSTGIVNHSDTNAHRKVDNFTYHIKNDTLFIDGPKRTFKIIKLEEDSLIISGEGITVRYYRVL